MAEPRITMKEVDHVARLARLQLSDAEKERMRRELDGDVRVVATGGFAEQMREVCQSLQEVNADLRLEGLRMIWERANPHAGVSPS